MTRALPGHGVIVTPEEGAVPATIQCTTCTKALAGKTAATAGWDYYTLGILQACF